MKTMRASSPIQLLQMLGSASGGDVILLEPGEYDALRISGVNIAGGVTIASADANDPAVLNGLQVENSSGIVFSHLVANVDPAGGQFQNHVIDSSDVHFKSMSFQGSLNGDPSDDMNGLFIQNSSSVSVAGSEFQQLRNGLVHSQSSDLDFVGNSFHDMRSDGIKGGGSSDVLISQNYFTDFYPVSGDHPDAIQFWTTNTTESASNIRILDNVIIQGDGHPIQGIFMGNELDITYQDVTISGNFVYAGFYHGISVYDVNGAQIHDNTVLSSPERKSPIRLFNSQGVAEMSGNSAILVAVDGTDLTSIGNTKIPAASDGGTAALTQWMRVDSSSLTDLPEVLGAGSPVHEASSFTVSVSGAELGTAPEPDPHPEPSPAPEPEPAPEPSYAPEQGAGLKSEIVGSPQPEIETATEVVEASGALAPQLEGLTGLFKLFNFFPLGKSSLDAPDMNLETAVGSASAPELPPVSEAGFPALAKFLSFFSSTNKLFETTDQAEQSAQAETLDLPLAGENSISAWDSMNFG